MSLNCVLNSTNSHSILVPFQRSQARIQLRVGLVHKNNLLAQKSFVSSVDVATPDAKGGAAAMSRASDQIIEQITAMGTTRATIS